MNSLMTSAGAPVADTQNSLTTGLRRFDSEQRVFSSIATAMIGVPEEIPFRQLTLFERVDRAYSEAVRGPWPCMEGRLAQAVEVYTLNSDGSS